MGTGARGMFGDFLKQRVKGSNFLYLKGPQIYCHRYFAYLPLCMKYAEADASLCTLREI